MMSSVKDNRNFQFFTNELFEAFQMKLSTSFKRPFTLFGLLLFFSLLSISSLLSAQSLTPNQRQAMQIMHETMSVHGDLTQDMHSRFWRLLDSSASGRVTDNELQFMRFGAELSLEIQRETWFSMKESWDQQRVLKTESLVNLMEDFPSVVRARSPYPVGSREYQDMMLALTREYARSFESVDAWLVAAGNRQSQVTTSTGTFHLSLDLIQTVNDQLEESFQRLQKLLQRTWSD